MSFTTSRRPACMAASIGAVLLVSSMKSPRCESSSSPIGVSIEIGSFAIFMILRILSSGISIFSASVGGVRLAAELLQSAGATCGSSC